MKRHTQRFISSFNWRHGDDHCPLFSPVCSVFLRWCAMRGWFEVKEWISDKFLSGWCNFSGSNWCHTLSRRGLFIPHCTVKHATSFGWPWTGISFFRLHAMFIPFLGNPLWVLLDYSWRLWNLPTVNLKTKRDCCFMCAHRRHCVVGSEILFISGNKYSVLRLERYVKDLTWPLSLCNGKYGVIWFD